MQKSNKKKCTLSIRVDTVRELREYCYKKGMPMSLFIDMAIEDNLNRLVMRCPVCGKEPYFTIHGWNCKEHGLLKLVQAKKGE